MFEELQYHVMTCTKCGRSGPQDEFSKFRRGNKVYRRHQCKACYLIRAREIRKDFHRKHVPYSKDKRLKRKYGISIHDYQQMVINQSGRCDICKSPESDKVKFQVDHCHKTGKIRSLLCNRCNSVLGFAQDSTEILQSAIKYLLTHK